MAHSTNRSRRSVLQLVFIFGLATEGLDGPFRLAVLDTFAGCVELPAFGRLGNAEHSTLIIRDEAALEAFGSTIPALLFGYRRDERWINEDRLRRPQPIDFDRHMIVVFLSEDVGSPPPEILNLWSQGGGILADIRVDETERSGIVDQRSYAAVLVPRVPGSLVLQT